jgi:L-alanine-DL-glutamate epimerase-like enolase superfamily enzyme
MLSDMNRRDLLKAGVFGVSAGALLGGEAFGMSKPLPMPEGGPAGRYEKVTRGKSDMKVKSVESFTEGYLSIVKVTADNGVEGYGQIAPYDADISAIVLHRHVVWSAIGKDPYDAAAVSDLCIDQNLKYPWSYVCRALAGLETALWDLRGKVEGKSVCELLGGEPRPLVVYGSSMSRQIKPADEAKRLVAFRDSNGYKAFKIRIGTPAGHNRDAWPGRTEEIVPTVRKAIGDDIALLVDANSCYTVDKAIEVGRMLEANNVVHFEEPCPYWEFEWAAEVAKAIKVPVAGGEQNNDVSQWRRIVGMRAYDIVQPDVCYIGGVTRTLRVAEMARIMNIPVVPHSANLSMVTTFALHIMGAISNAGDHIEYTIEDDSWTKDLFEPAMEIRDGKVAIPEGPGWGVTINKKWLEKAKHQISS